jgi:hypothetical protein
VSPTIPLHLRILARLGHVLHDAELRALLQGSGSASQVMARIQALEAGLDGRRAADAGPTA